MSETEAQNTVEEALPIGDGKTDAEAMWDSVLEQMDSEEDDVGVEATEPAPVKKETREVEEAKEDIVADNSDDREQPVTEEPDGDLEKSLSVLRRDGLPNTVIEKMTNDEVLALAAKRSKVQRDTDDAYRQLQDMKKAKETAPESGEESDASGSDEPSPVNLDDAIQPFVKLYGQEAGEALKAAQEASVGPVVQQLRAAQNMVENMLLDLSRGKLTDKYPQLSEGDDYARVRTRMENLIKTGEYKDIESLMSDASRLEFGEETAVASRELKAHRNRQKTDGQMTPAEGGETPVHSLTTDERQEALLDALEGGMEVAEARRRYGA